MDRSEIDKIISDDLIKTVHEAYNKSGSYKANFRKVAKPDITIMVTSSLPMSRELDAIIKPQISKLLDDIISYYLNQDL